MLIFFLKFDKVLKLILTIKRKSKIFIHIMHRFLYNIINLNFIEHLFLNIISY